MKKLYLLFIMVFFLNVSNANAWEMDNYTSLPADSAEIEKTKTQNIEQNKNIEQKKSLRRHSLSFEYNWLTMTDFVVVVASVFGDAPSPNGAISVDYGYAFAEHWEMGLIFNYALLDRPIVTVMPKIKLNTNLGGTINPFMELDMGVTYSNYTNRILPMGHVTLLGLEIGYPVALRFQIPFLLWGQRGVSYIGFTIRF